MEDKRLKQIEEFESERERRLARKKVFEDELLKLKLSLAIMDKEQARGVQSTLDNLGDMSPKGAVDAILKLPMEKRQQLDGNIRKVELAISNEQKQGDIAGGKAKAIKDKIFNDGVDNHTRIVFKVFEDWLQAYKDCKSVFGKLTSLVQDGYNFDPQFHRRADNLGLNKSIMVSIESHIRNGERVYMTEVLEKIMDLSDAYGSVPLLEKDFVGTWPSSADGQFFSEL